MGLCFLPGFLLSLELGSHWSWNARSRLGLVCCSGKSSITSRLFLCFLTQTITSPHPTHRQYHIPWRTGFKSCAELRQSFPPVPVSQSEVRLQSGSDANSKFTSRKATAQSYYGSQWQGVIIFCKLFETKDKQKVLPVVQHSPAVCI